MHQCITFILFWDKTLHVSDDYSVLHQEFKTVVSVLQDSACNTDTTPAHLHRNSNTHRTKNNTTNVVIQQNSRKLLMMDILMSETC